MKPIVLLLMLFNVAILFSQLGPAPQTTAFENDPMANFNKWTPMMQKLFQQVKNDSETVSYYVGAQVGSPYEYEEFRKGKVYYEKEYLGDFFYRLNLFRNEVEVKRTLLEEEKYKALVANEKVSLIANGKEYRFLSFQNEKKNIESGYLTTLLNGTDYKLYKRVVAKFTEAKAAANSMVNPTPSKFTQFTEYYIQHGAGNEIVELPTKKNKMLKLFDSTVAKEIKEYITGENINLAQENDLIKTIAFLDSSNLN